MPETTTPSPLPSARTSILRSKSNSDISTTSSDSKGSSITFAPLPCIEGRKRRNSRPIGLASRAEMLRRTRRQFLPHEYESQHLPPDDDDIPLPDLGKLVKGLWRSVSRGQSMKDRNSGEASRPQNSTILVEGTKQDEGEGGVWMDEVTWSPMINPSTTILEREEHPS